MLNMFVKISAIFGVLGFCCSYDLGVRYSYTYNTNVIIEEDCHIRNKEESQNAGYQIQSSVYITSIWEDEMKGEEKILKIELIKPSLLVPQKSSFKNHQSKLESFPKSTLLVQWVNGEVKDVFSDSSDDKMLKNLKKGIASLLQIQKYNKKFFQTDISGECLVHLKVDGKFIKKIKEKCSHPTNKKSTADLHGVRSANIKTTSETITELISEASKLILSIKGEDLIEMHSNMWKGSSVCVSSKIYMKLEDRKSEESTIAAENFLNAVKAYSTELKANFMKDSLLVDFTSSTYSGNCRDLMKTINGYKEALKVENLAKLKSASSYLKLIDCLRLATKEDIISVLKNKKYGAILPQLLDTIAAAQTEASITAVFEVLDFLGNDINLQEQYLLTVSTVPNPNIELFRAIMNLLLKEVKGKIHETLIMTLGAITKSFVNKEKNEDEDQILQDIKNFFMQRLSSCENTKCKVTYLRGLQNAQIPDSVPVLLNFIKDGGKPAFEALLALKHIGVQYYDTEVLKTLQKAFYQIGAKQDSSSRATAAELLLVGNDNSETLKYILSALIKEDNLEFSTFVISKLIHVMEQNRNFRYDIKRTLADTKANYLYMLSQKGSSASFSKALISTEEMNTTYNLEMEMVPGGLLKRSSFNIEIETPTNNLHMLSVGIFAEGLSSLVGGSSDTNYEGSEDTIAGMELNVLGVALRPYIFFQSTSELMSHVWSGTGSEPTSALQGNFLLIDDAKSVILQNGLIAELKLRGCLSADLSAYIQISIWNRNSHSVVTNAAALLVKSSAHISTPFINLVGEFSFKGQSAIDFTTELNFYENPYQMCLKMDQPDFLFRSDWKILESIPGSKYLAKRKRKKTIFVPPKSYSFHRKNNEQCNLMFPHST